MKNSPLPKKDDTLLYRLVESGQLTRSLDMLLRLALAFVFFWACQDKLANPKAFADIIAAYRILPDALVPMAAVALPWIELFIAVSLVTKVWRSGALLLANMLMVTFFSALVFNALRGLDVNCGCFTTSPEHTGSMKWYLLRDGMLLALCLAAGWFHIKVEQEKESGS